MKNKKRTALKTMVYLVAAGVAFTILFLFIDAAFGSVICKWFDAGFISVGDRVTMGNGRTFEVITFQWQALKIFCFISGIAIVVTCTGICLIFTNRARREAENRTIEELTSLVRQYFDKENVDSYEISKNYSAITDCLQNINNQIYHKEQLLYEENSRKDDLIAYLAHDLKTPLTSVIGYLNLLDEAPDMPDSQKEKYIHTALDKSNRLEKLINEFFDITRYNIHEIVLEQERIDLKYMLLQMADEFYPILQEHQNTVQLKAEDGITVLADRDKLARVFNNVLKNAICYSYPNTEILISVERTDSQVMISIANCGRTIPAQKLNTIFEKFYRLDDSRSSYTGGAGLGLAIAKEIVAAHNGSITAESSDQETVFRIMLPD